MIVGAGNSAVQIGVELAHHARVTLATRNAVKFVPQRPLGRDLHFWFTAFGIDQLPIGPQLRIKPTVPVFDTGAYRSTINADQPRRVPLFTDVDGARVTWPDGRSGHVDTILLATGYRPDLGYLANLGALDRIGAPQQLRGLSITHPGLGYVGLEWQRSLASASLRGVGRDADYVTAHLLRRVNVRARCCAALRS